MEGTEVQIITAAKTWETPSGSWTAENEEGHAHQLYLKASPKQKTDFSQVAFASGSSLGHLPVISALIPRWHFTVK